MIPPADSLDWPRYGWNSRFRAYVNVNMPLLKRGVAALCPIDLRAG